MIISSNEIKIISVGSQDYPDLSRALPLSKSESKEDLLDCLGLDSLDNQLLVSFASFSFSHLQCNHRLLKLTNTTVTADL